MKTFNPSQYECLGIFGCSELPIGAIALRQWGYGDEDNCYAVDYGGGEEANAAIPLMGYESIQRGFWPEMDIYYIED